MDPLDHLATGLAGSATKLQGAGGRDLDVEVDEIQEQLLDRRPVPRYLPGRTRAEPGVVAETAARAGAHGGDQKEPGREPVAGASRTLASMVFERLPERPESKPPEGREVVEEQSPAAGEVHLTWLPIAGEVERAR
jgi:hypothetical protein